MEENTEFLKKATDLFIENGAKTLTMDEIAKEFDISKKTIYQKYKNKDELLEEVLGYILAQIIEKIKYSDQNIENAIERMICRDVEFDKVSNTNKTLFIRQLIKYYPNIFNKHMLDFSEKFSAILVHNIDKGRQQGLYRENFDPEIYSKMFFQLVMSYDSSPFLDTSVIDRAYFNHETLMMYMNAITTEKGKETLKKIKNKDEEVH